MCVPPSINNLDVISQDKQRIMAKSSSCTSLNSFFLFSSILFTSYMISSEAEANPPAVNGLSYSFYSQTCPNLQTIVTNHLTKVFQQTHWQAPALLVIFFHDCFVQVPLILRLEFKV